MATIDPTDSSVTTIKAAMNTELLPGIPMPDERFQGINAAPTSSPPAHPSRPMFHHRADRMAAAEDDGSGSCAERALRAIRGGWRASFAALLPSWSTESTFVAGSRWRHVSGGRRAVNRTRKCVGPDLPGNHLFGRPNLGPPGSITSG